MVFSKSGSKKPDKSEGEAKLWEKRTAPMPVIIEHKILRLEWPLSERVNLTWENRHLLF